MDERESLPSVPGDGPPCLSWDTFCDLLDDVPWDAVTPRLPSFRRNTGSCDEASFLRAQLSGPGQYFLDANPPRRAHEVFWLKLSLFETLCRRVASVHARTQRPLLALDPGHVLITLPDRGRSYVPLRWGCTLTVEASNERSQLLFDDMPPEMASGLSAVPQDVDLCYASPSVREWPLGREVAATALIQSADALPDEDEGSIRGLVRVHVITDGISAPAFSPHDVFRLVFPVELGKGVDVRVWARKVDVPERGIVLSGVTDVLSLEVWKAFEGASGHAKSDARALVYRTFPPSCDLYSLGMLLLRALLGSDARRWECVTAALPALLEGLAPAVQGVELSDFYVLHVRMRERLCESQDLFLPSDISDDLWWDALTLALRALSTIPGFSYAVPLSGEGRSSETSGVDTLSEDVAHLAGRARVELFEAGDRDRAIQTACDRLLADLGTS